MERRVRRLGMSSIRLRSGWEGGGGSQQGQQGRALVGRQTEEDRAESLEYAATQRSETRDAASRSRAAAEPRGSWCTGAASELVHRGRLPNST